MLTRIYILLVLTGCLAVKAATNAPAPALGSPHDYLVHVWQTDSGLPQNWVSSIAQTPDGYLWIGTRYGGLARFDGVRFVPFNPQNTPAIKDVQVERLSVDETGCLWMVMGNESVTAMQHNQFSLAHWPRTEPRMRLNRALTVSSNQIIFADDYSVLAKLDLAQGTNGWSILDPRPKILPEARTFVRDHTGTIWFITAARRLARYQNDQFEFVNRANGVDILHVSALATDRQQRLWLATPNRIFQWTGAGVEQRTPTNGPLPKAISQIAFSGDDGLWLLDGNRVRKCLAGQWAAAAELKNFSTNASADAVQMHGDVQGGVWLIRYGQGLWHVKADGTARQLTERDGLPSVFITCWFQDDEGDVWVGTAGGGIARIRESVFQVLGPDKGLPGKVVRSVCEDAKAGLWVGTMSGGVARWKDGQFTTVPSPDATPLESVTVMPEPNGNLWVGTLNRGLLRLQAGKLTPFSTPYGIGSAIRVLFMDRQEQLWIGGLVNLCCYTGGQFKSYGASEGFVDGHAIGAMAEDADGALWIGTGPGELWKFSGGKFTRFTPPAAWPSVRISAVQPDTNGVVWVGTLGGGLLRFHNGQFTRCTIQNGLPDNNVTQLLDSGDGDLWAGTYAGIFCASKAELQAACDGQMPQVQCRVYGRYDGLSALECSSGFQPACWRMRDGQLCFSTANGVVTVNPGEVRANPRPPLVIIEEMLVDGQPRALAASQRNARLSIEPGRHYVQFRFTGLNFTAPDGVRFRVKLDGGDAHWRDVGDERLTGYGPLPPGDYQFHVIGCNNDGVWDEQGATLAFTVLPYFWETWWFKVTLGGLAFGALAVIVALAQRRRYRNRLEKAERQRAMERERARIARDLHDDLGTSLTQISMLSALANRASTPAAEVKDLLDQVRQRARHMVTALDEIVWALNPRNDSLAGLVNYLGHFAEEFFRPTTIRCRLDIPTQLPEHIISADTRHHLFLAFKEALNNAARHSGAEEIEVRMAFSANELSVTVQDNGCGFDLSQPANEAVSNGLINMQKRMEQVGGHAHLQSEPKCGTTVIFRLPLGT